MTNPLPRQGKPRVLRRVAATTAAVAIVAAGACALAACILADPPAELDPEVPRRPIILREQVVPPPTAILRTWPSKFEITIETSPTATIYWQEYFDAVPREVQGRNDPTPANQDGGVRVIDLPEELETTTDCHVFEVVFALGFGLNNEPTGPGGDSISWFYSPSGDLTTCSVADSGARAPDADAGDALSEGAATE